MKRREILWAWTAPIAIGATLPAHGEMTDYAGEGSESYRATNEVDMDITIQIQSCYFRGS